MMHFLYVTAKVALEVGMTHEGMLYGVPAWFRVDEDAEEVVMATPKIPLLNLWTRGADWVFEALSYFVPSDVVIETPITIGKPIEVRA